MVRRSKKNYIVEFAQFVTSKGLEKSDKLGKVTNYANRGKLYHRSSYTLS